MKIRQMKLITPLYYIEIIKESKEITSDSLNKMLEEWGEILSGDTKWFKFPTEDNKVYVIPREVLKNSYIEVDMEEDK